jgi:hypothetical protein
MFLILADFFFTWGGNWREVWPQRRLGLGKENRAWRAGTGWLQGSSRRAQAGTARKEELAGRRGAGQVWSPHHPPRPVRQGKEGGPAEGVQGRSVRGRVGLPAGRDGKGGLGCGLLTTCPGQYGKERRAGRQEGCKAGRYGG